MALPLVARRIRPKALAREPVALGMGKVRDLVQAKDKDKDNLNHSQLKTTLIKHFLQTGLRTLTTPRPKALKTQPTTTHPSSIPNLRQTPPKR